MSVEEVSMDPEVMVTVDRLVFQYLSGALHEGAATVSEGQRGIPNNATKDVRR